MKVEYAQIFDLLYKQLSLVATSTLNDIQKEILDVRSNSDKVLIGGNGGSHSIASHLSVDMTKACGVSSIAFSDPSLITCLANDYGYEYALQKFIEFYHKSGDLVILISSSGESRNIINAAEAAKEIGLKLITLSGFSQQNALMKLGDINVHIPCNHYNIVENCHQIILTTVMDMIAGNLVNNEVTSNV